MARSSAPAAPIAIAATASAAALRVVNPPEGATYLIDPTLRREFQTLPLRAVAAGRGQIEWRVDGQPVGRGAGDTAVAGPLASGRHVVSARDADGRQAEAAFVVK